MNKTPIETYISKEEIKFLRDYIDNFEQIYLGQKLLNIQKKISRFKK